MSYGTTKKYFRALYGLLWRKKMDEKIRLRRGFPKEEMWAFFNPRRALS